MAHSLQTYINELINRSNNLDFEAVLQLLADTFPGQVTFSSSFSFEDQAITHAIADNQLPITVFTLDTGRLFPETYSVWSSTRERYSISINAYYPDQASLETFITKTGPNSFYESVDNRKTCCHIRKVEPLKRALNGNAVWITGLRAAHSANRQDLSTFEWDDSNQIIKYHPLLHW